MTDSEKLKAIRALINSMIEYTTEDEQKAHESMKLYHRGSKHAYQHVANLIEAFK